jgi:hypothetical protein
MGATVAIKQATGAGPDYATVDNGANPLRFCCADTHDPGLATPLVIHASGVGNFNYSFWVHLFLDLSGAYTRINNVRFYSDGTIGWALGTGGKFMVAIMDAGDNGIATGSYDQAAGAGDSGYYIATAGATGHQAYNGQVAAPALVSAYTSAATLLVDSANHDASAAEKTKGVVLQIKVDGDATHGELADEVLSFVWDEI